MYPLQFDTPPNAYENAAVLSIANFLAGTAATIVQNSDHRIKGTVIPNKSYGSPVDAPDWWSGSRPAREHCSFLEHGSPAYRSCPRRFGSKEDDRCWDVVPQSTVAETSSAGCRGIRSMTDGKGDRECCCWWVTAGPRSITMWN